MDESSPPSSAASSGDPGPAAPSLLPPENRDASAAVWILAITSAAFGLGGLAGALSASLVAVGLGALGAVLALFGVAFAEGRRLAHLRPLGISLAAIAVGLFKIGDAVMHIEIGKMDGRPFRTRGRPRQARLVRSEAWRAGIELPVFEPGDQREVERLSARALAEHASIAAFAQLTLDLLAHGAPPRLIQGALSAALDEVEHARVACALASAHAGAPLGPGALREASPDVAPLLALARASDVDGVANEGAAAMRLLAEARQMTCPSVRALLERIAVDEQRHAALAAEVSAWCVETAAASS